MEPFGGSLAVLLARPDDRWQTGAETVNDKDAYLCNFWRALAHDPEQTAHYANYPVNETDLLARHLWIVNTVRERIQQLESDPDFYDAKVAGWWAWGICSWIGNAWCDGKGPHTLGTIKGIKDTAINSVGVHRSRPHLANAGRGVNRKLPHLGNAGQGVKRGAVCHDLALYFGALATRLRRVRVCGGDWARVVTTGALSYATSVGIFLDPPYQGALRDKNLYRMDDHNISIDVRDWAIANGDNPRYRIVLAGYEKEHSAAMPSSWRIHAWTAGPSMATSTSTDSRNATNRHEERLWLSPHCLNPQPELTL